MGQKGERNKERCGGLYFKLQGMNQSLLIGTRSSGWLRSSSIEEDAVDILAATIAIGLHVLQLEENCINL